MLQLSCRPLSFEDSMAIFTTIDKQLSFLMVSVKVLWWNVVDEIVWRLNFYIKPWQVSIWTTRAKHWTTRPDETNKHPSMTTWTICCFKNKLTINCAVINIKWEWLHRKSLQHVHRLCNCEFTFTEFASMRLEFIRQMWSNYCIRSKNSHRQGQFTIMITFVTIYMWW